MSQCTRVVEDRRVTRERSGFMERFVGYHKKGKASEASSFTKRGEREKKGKGLASV